jgi:hypothetical protein
MLICILIFVLRKNKSKGKRRSEAKAWGSADLILERATSTEDKTATWSPLARGQSIIQQLCFSSAFIPSALALLHNWILSGIQKRRKVGYKTDETTEKWIPSSILSGDARLESWSEEHLSLHTYTCNGHSATWFKFSWSVRINAI